MFYHYSFSIHGLSITGLSNGQHLTVVYDPKATAALFEKLGLIEDFDLDYNSEPVILYTDSNNGKSRIGWCLWSEFVMTFPFVRRHAEIIWEARANEASFQNSQSIILNLLSPLLAS